MSTRNLPLSAVATEFARRQFYDLSDAEMADVEFGPWDLAELCEPPTNKDWTRLSLSMLMTMRLAYKTVGFTKAEVVDVCKKMEGQYLDKLLSDTQFYAKVFRTHAALLETAQDRMMIALAVMKAEVDDEAETAGLAS